MGAGFTGVALSGLLDGAFFPARAEAAKMQFANPLAPKTSPRPAKAKSVIFLFMYGGPSQVDTFDYKPELIRRHGQPLPGAEKLVTFQGENGALARSPWEFRPRGESGKMTSELLPQLGAQADRMCFWHSLTSRTNTHGPGEMYNTKRVVNSLADAQGLKWRVGGGTVNLRQRAEALGGTATVDSAEPRGTVVRWSVPTG